ncbi:MAG: transglycosylase family protein [Acidimicrobiales bacterium]
MCHKQAATTVLVALIAAASILLTVGPASPAGAGQLGSLKAQARTISQQLVQDQLEAGAYQQQYSVLTLRVAADQVATEQTARQIALDQQLITEREIAVERAAVRSYMNYGSSPNGVSTVLFAGNQSSAQAASEYSTIAAGDIGTAVDQLHTAQQQLVVHQDQLRQQQQSDVAAQARQALALRQAYATTTQLESLQSRVTGELAAAVAAQAQAAAQAAAAAVASAQRAAASMPSSASAPHSYPPSYSSAVPTASTGSGSAPPAPSGGNLVDPALSPYLQCVVQAESGGDYSIVSANGLYMGAFQFAQASWNYAAQAAGLSYLVGVPPNQATRAEQDTLAVTLYSLDGQQPWLGDRCSS